MSHHRHPSIDVTLRCLGGLCDNGSSFLDKPISRDFVVCLYTSFGSQRRFCFSKMISMFHPQPSGRVSFAVNKDMSTLRLSLRQRHVQQRQCVYAVFAATVTFLAPPTGIAFRKTRPNRSDISFTLSHFWELFVNDRSCRAFSVSKVPSAIS